MTQPLKPDDDSGQHKTLYEGVARGGPLNGQTVQSRYPEGILAVDKQAGRCWIYDTTDNDWNTYFHVREEEGRPLDTERRISAADEPRFDVQAVVTS